MKLDKTYISDKNSYAGQKPIYLVVHNTDNYNAGADARSHARAQHDGNFHGMSAHVYVDDKEAYQALPFSRGAWHVGVDYGGRLFGIVNNRNSVGIEMCVQKGYDYERAFQNTVQVCQMLMKELGIPADRVVQHYDVCGKNCPSAIRAQGDWTRFQNALRKGEGAVGMVEPKKKGGSDRTFYHFPSGDFQRMQRKRRICASGIFADEDRWEFRKRNRAGAGNLSKTCAADFGWNLRKEYLESGGGSYEGEYICRMNDVTALIDHEGNAVVKYMYNS